MKVYCTSCGSGTEYSLKKPQFCCSCGDSFTKVNTNAPRKVFKAAANVASVTPVNEEEEYEEEYVPSLDGLDFDIEKSQTFSSVPLDKIAGTNDGGRDNYRREADQSYSKESIATDLMREAGSSRSPNAKS